MTLISSAGAGNCVSIISLETNPTPPSHISGGCIAFKTNMRIHLNQKFHPNRSILVTKNEGLILTPNLHSYFEINRKNEW